MTVYSSGGSDLLQVSIDTKGLETQMARAPVTVYFWLRNYLGSAFGKHRQQWLRDKGTKFGRGGAGSKATKVWPVNEGPASPQPQDVTYSVLPRDVRVSERDAAKGLRSLAGEAQAGSLVLRVHEFGQTISGKLMALPVRTRPGSPAAWRKANPSKTLVAKPGRGGQVLLYERTRKPGRGRAKPSADGKPSKRRQTEKLRLRFILTRRVTNRATLHMYDTWRKLKAYRDQQWKRALDRIEADFNKGART